MSEELKNMKLELLYPTLEGKTESKEMTIKVNTPKLKDRTAQLNSYMNPQRFIYQLSFSLKIPDHIHAELIGKSVPNFGSLHSDMREFPADFPKTLTFNSIETLTEKWVEVVRSYNWLRQLATADLKKVIFYAFTGTSRNHRSEWNGIEYGPKSSMSSMYAIGYISKVSDKEIRYNSEKLMVNSQRDSAFYRHKFVEWTPEREAFFQNIEKGFAEMTSKMNEFENNLNEETINSVMAGNFKLLS